MDSSTNTSECLVCGHTDATPFLHAPDRFHGRTMRYELVRCSNCSLVWLKNAPRPDQMGEHYGSAYDRFIAVAGDSSPAKWKDRSDVISRYWSEGTILDLGCGTGAFLGSLQRENWKLNGIEISELVAKKAEARTGAKVFVGDILRAPFPAESFDVITCFDVLEHVYEPRKVLERVRKWLKPGGIFFTLLPNIDSGEARLFKSYWYGLELPRHISHFSPQSLRFLAKSVGLQEASVATQRNSAMEHSLRYLGDSALERLGISRKPLAETGSAGLPWKIVRQLLRWSAFSAIHHATRLKGPGESIHAVLRKATGETGSGIDDPSSVIPVNSADKRQADSTNS